MIGVEQQHQGWIEIADPAGLTRTGGLHPMRYAFPIEIRHRRAKAIEIALVAAVMFGGVVAFYMSGDPLSTIALSVVLTVVTAAYFRLYSLDLWPRDVGPLVAKIDREGFCRLTVNGPELLFKWSEVRRSGRICRNDADEFLVELRRPIHGVKRPTFRAFWEAAPETEFALATDGLVPEERELQLIVERMIADAGGRIVKVWW